MDHLFLGLLMLTLVLNSSAHQILVTKKFGTG